MTDVHQKKVVKNTTNAMNAIVAGVAGVIAGGAAVAAAVIMSDKKNQKSVKNAFIDAKEKVTDYIDTIKTQPIIKKSVLKIESKT